MTEPIFTIITPAYNAESRVAAAIESVIAQTCSDWEMRIVDDGSSDGTAEVLEEWAGQDARIWWTSQENAGASVARNTAMEGARGKYFVLLDDDDVLLPRYLERQLEFMEANPGFDIYSCDALLLFPDGRLVKRVQARRMRREVSLSYKQMLRHNAISITTVFNRKTLELAGGFTPGVWAQDYDFWLKAMSRGARHLHNPEVLAHYSVRDGAASVSLSEVVKSVIGILESLRADETDNDKLHSIDSALRSWHRRLDLAELEVELAAGRCPGCRGRYLRCGWSVPFKLKFAMGAPLMMLSPALYRAVFLRRIVRSLRLSNRSDS